MTKKPHYGKCKVLGPDGKFMFRCNERKMNFYLKNNLAEIRTIQLTFEPKGPGNIGDPYYEQQISDQCVVCGSKDDLTVHHAVPRNYRVWFPDNLKNHASHDILLVCDEHHQEYERLHARKLKKKIAEEHGIPECGKGGRCEIKIQKLRSYAHAIYNYGSKIPKDRIEILKAPLREYFGRNPSDAELAEACHFDFWEEKEGKYINHGKYVVEHVNLEDFVIRWRSHFMETMKPKYLPDNWDARRPLEGA